MIHGARDWRNLPDVGYGECELLYVGPGDIETRMHIRLLSVELFRNGRSW